MVLCNATLVLWGLPAETQHAVPFSRTSASVVQEILFLWTHFLVRPNSQIRFCYGSCTVLTQNDLWDSERERSFQKGSSLGLLLGAVSRGTFFIWKCSWSSNTIFSSLCLEWSLCYLHSVSHVREDLAVVSGVKAGGGGMC